MRTCLEMLEILDEYLKNKNLSRRQFCSLVNIPNSTISSWKQKNVLPSIEVVTKIAQFMNVSLDWLVYDDIVENQDNSYENVYSRRSIFYRIKIVLRQKNNDYDTESLYNKYLKDIVDYEVLINWVEGRANIAEDVLPKIAAQLDVSLQWLLTKDEYHQEDFDAHICSLAIKYPGLLKGYNDLNEEEQKFIDHYITSCLEINQFKRQVELNNKNDQNDQ